MAHMMVMGTTNSSPFEPIAPWLDVFLLMAGCSDGLGVPHGSSKYMGKVLKGLSTSTLSL